MIAMRDMLFGRYDLIIRGHTVVAFEFVSDAALMLHITRPKT